MKNMKTTLIIAAIFIQLISAASSAVAENRHRHESANPKTLGGGDSGS
jgi:hypothetical protein